MRVLILGATGQLGSRLAKSLYAKGFDVVATSRTEEGCRDGIRYVRRDPMKAYWGALGRFDVLVNTIGALSDRPDLLTDVHVGIPKAIVEHYRLLGSPFVLQLSALGAREGHPSRFLATKAVGDRLFLSALGSHVCVLRPSIVCTPETRIVRKLARVTSLARWTRGLLPAPWRLLRSRLQPLSMDDLDAVVGEIVSGARTPAPILNLGGSDVFSVGDLIRMAFAARGLAFHALSIPLGICRLGLSMLPTAMRSGLLTREEMLLLQSDNTLSSQAEGAYFVGGATRPFFEEAFRDRPGTEFDL